MTQLLFDSILEETEPVQEPNVEQLKLEIQEDCKLRFSNCNSGLTSIYTWTPKPNIIFSDANKECGRFSWEGGVFKFEGNSETSAKLFANLIAQYCGLKVQS